MSVKDSVRSTMPATEGQPSIMQGTVVKAPVNEQDRVSVIIPEYDAVRDFECLWSPRGLAMPIVGDAVIIEQDSDGDYHVIAWYPDPPRETTALAGVKGFVNHGADANHARPSGFGSVEWIGSVAPNNAEDNDTWIETP